MTYLGQSSNVTQEKMASLNSFRQRATKLRLYLQLLLLLTTRKYANIPSYIQGPIERT